MSGVEDMLRYWRGRSARERLVLGAGVGLTLVLAAYGWVWRPMVADLARLEEQLPRMRAQAAQLRQAGDEIARLRAQAPGGRIEAGAIGTLLTRSAATHQIAGIALATDPASARVKVTIERTRFDAWLAWLDELHRSHRIVLVATRIVALETAGMIRAEAEFAPAAEQK